MLYTPALVFKGGVDAINVLLNVGRRVISEGLGHSSEKMTYTYLAMFEQCVLDAANERIATAISRATSKFSARKRGRPSGAVQIGV